jgi:hypothetical protein
VKKRLIHGLACAGITLLISCAARNDPRAAAPSPEPARPPLAASAPLSSAPEAPSPAPGGLLSLGPLTLTNDRGNGLVLASDGAVSKLPGGEPVGKLGSDGQFVLSSGRRGPKLEADGSVVAANGQKLPLRIAEDGAVEVENTGSTSPLRFDDAGRLVGGNPDAPRTEVAGLTPALRRTAAFLLILAAFPVRQ